MKIDFRLPAFEISPLGARAHREDGFLYVRIYLLNIIGCNNDVYRSLFEFWFDEEAAAHCPDQSAHYELHLLFLRLKFRFSSRKVARLTARVNPKTPNV